MCGGKAIKYKDLSKSSLIDYTSLRYKNRPVMTGPGLYDPTRIMNQDNLSKNMREGWVKLLFYLLSFFYYIYGMVSSLIASS